MSIDMMKLAIEDNAFTAWAGCTLESAECFVKEYFEQFPGFKEKWTTEELAEQLMERL